MARRRPAGIGGGASVCYRCARVEELVSRFGLPAHLVLTAIEGDLALILGGVAAHLGLMSPLAVIAVGTLGGFAGDAAWFAIGRRTADTVRSSAAYRRVGPTLERLVARFGPRQVLLARPVYGTRVATMLFWGSQGLAPTRFAAYVCNSGEAGGGPRSWAMTPPRRPPRAAGRGLHSAGRIQRVDLGHRRGRPIVYTEVRRQPAAGRPNDLVFDTEPAASGSPTTARREPVSAIAAGCTTLAPTAR